MDHREVCRDFDRARHVPIAGTSGVSMSNDKPQVALLSLDDTIALSAMGVFSKYSLVVPARTKNCQEAWGVFSGPRIFIFGHLSAFTWMMERKGE